MSAARQTAVPTRQTDWRRVFWMIAVPFAALKLALLAAAAVRVRFVMDELIQASYSLYIPRGFYRGFHDTKTFLYVYYFDVARLLTHDSVSLMLAARLEGLALAFGMVLFVYAIARNLGRDRAEAFLAAVCLLSVSVFMERGFRVRSDTLAVFFSTAALWWATRSGAAETGRDSGVGLLAALAFLSTQKSAYVVMAIGAAYFASEGRRFLRAAVPAAAGFWAALFAYAVYFGGARFPAVLREIFVAPIENPLIHGTAAYPHIHKYVGMALERNPVAYFVMALGLAAAVAKWRSVSRAGRFAVVMTAAVAGFFFLHDQTWPYVLLWPLPFLAIWAPAGVEWIAHRGKTPRELAAAGLLAMLCISFVRNYRYLRLSNTDQEKTMATAESLLAPGDRYADGVWMLPTRFHAGLVWWEAATIAKARRALAQGDATPLQTVFREQPKVWIMNYRVAALWDYLRPILRHSYVAVAPGVLLSGAPVEPAGTTKFENRWRGTYSLYDASGRPVASRFVLDGRRAEGPIEILPGPHLLAPAGANPPGSLFLFPSGLLLPGPLPSSVQGPDLFAGVYDY